MAKNDSDKPAPKKTAKKAPAKKAVKVVKKKPRRTTAVAMVDKALEGFEVESHIFVPKHELLDEKEHKTLLERYGAAISDLPKIRLADKGIRHLSAKEGDIIKIIRDSPTAGTAIFYRVVVRE